MAFETLALPEEDPKLNHLVAAQLCKTKMCAMFTRGQCRDEACRFAHSRMELRSAPDLTKTAMCRAFARGRCKDPACRFAHGEEELRVTPTVYKTQLCNFFERGRCKKGDRCRHAHGTSELRSFEARRAEKATPTPATPMPASLMTPPGFRESCYAEPLRGTPEPMKVLLPSIPQLPNLGLEQPPYTPPRPEKPQRDFSAAAFSSPQMAGLRDQEAMVRKLTFSSTKEETAAASATLASIRTDWRPDQIRSSSTWVV